MSEERLSTELEAAQEEMARAEVRELLLTELRCPFGPRFFLGQLAAFVRDRCPDPAEHLPRVELWVGGERIPVCHVIAVTPHWVALAAQGEGNEPRMRTELVPYALIGRVTIGRSGASGHSVGFDVGRRPLVLAETGLSPEEALAAIAQPPHRAEDRTKS